MFAINIVCNLGCNRGCNLGCNLCYNLGCNLGCNRGCNLGCNLGLSCLPCTEGGSCSNGATNPLLPRGRTHRKATSGHAHRGTRATRGSHFPEASLRQCYCAPRASSPAVLTGGAYLRPYSLAHERRVLARAPRRPHSPAAVLRPC